MQALVMAMLLTSAGGLAETQARPLMPPPIPAPPMSRPAPEGQARRPQLLRGHLVDYLTSADYPAGALPENGHALVGVRLEIDAEGRVTRCTDILVNSVRALNEATCRALTERARYRPALDAAGRPVPGREIGFVAWEAPRAPGASARLLVPPPVPMVSPPPPPRFIPPQRARANLSSYFSVDDYPVAAIVARHEGTTSFTLTIGPNGRATECRITHSSGSGPLDAATCRILRSRTRYTPARDQNGNPIAGRDSGRVTWRLPQNNADRAGLPMAYTPARKLIPEGYEMLRLTAADLPPGVPPLGERTESDLRLAIGRDGTVIGCDIEESSGSAALDEAACRLFSARARFSPGQDQSGAAVCDIAWETVDWARAGRGAPPPQPGTRTRNVRPPPPLERQLNAGLCPGWTRR